MAKQTRRELYITCNGKSADQLVQLLTNHLNQLNASLEKMRKEGKEGTKEYRDTTAAAKQLSKQLKDNISDTEMIDKVMKNLAGSSTKQLRSALNAVRREMERTSESSGKLPQLRKQFEQLKAQIDKNTGAVHKHGNAWQTAMKNLTAYVGMFTVFNKAKEMMTGVIKKNFEYSDSLANVRKVSNLSTQSVNELSQMLAKIDSRTSLEGLTQLAYVGSRMGMGKYGAEGLAEFAAASDRVNVALKEDLGDDAMLTLSKFVETMGEVEKHGGNISSAFDAVSSSVFKLASSSTSNGSNILEFAKRMTGLSKVTHITSDELLGLASASDSLMLMPEVASTAVSKFVSSLWTNYHEIEKMLGMEQDSLKDLMSKGHTMEAFVEVLRNVSNENLNSMDEYFKEFGSDGTRLKNTIVTLAQNIGVVEEHLKTSNKAYEDATAVTTEYNIQQKTAQALLERANNLWSKAFVNSDGVDNVRVLAQTWYDLSKSIVNNEAAMFSLRSTLGIILFMVKSLIRILPALAAGLLFKGVSAAIIGMKNAFTGMGEMALIATLRTEGLTAAWKRLSTAMKANWISLIIGLVVELGVALVSLTKNEDEAASKLDEFDKSLDSVYRNANKAESEVRAYAAAIDGAGKGTNERTEAIKQFNNKFGSYLTNLITEKSTVNELKQAYDEAARAIRAKMYLEMKQEDIQKHYKPRAGWMLDRQNEYGKVASETFGEDMLAAYEEDNKSKNRYDVFKELAKRFGSKNSNDVWQALQDGKSKATKKVNYWTLSGNLSQDKDLPMEDQRLFYAMRYIMQARSARNTMLQIDRKYDPVEKDIEKFLKRQDTREELTNEEKSHKGGDGKTSTNHNPNKDAANSAKTEANALVANIKAFYEEQQRKYLQWVTQMNEDGEVVSEGQQNQMLDYLEVQMKTALGKARHSISLLDDGWEQFKQTMSDDIMVTTDETSQKLLDSIGKSDINELHKLFKKLSADLSRENNKSLSENLGALLDQIFANGSAELRAAAEKLLARQREIQGILNERDYTGSVNRATRSKLDTLGLLVPTEGVGEDSESGLKAMNDAFDNLTKKARESVVELYQLKPESETFRDDFLSFMSVANDGFDFASLNTQKTKALYIELLKYTDQYTEAEKKAADERKKVYDFLWDRKGMQATQDKRTNSLSQINKGTERFWQAGKGNDSDAPRSGIMGGSKFMDQFSYNGDIEQSKMEITLLQEKIKWLQLYGATSEQIAEQQTLLQQKQDAYISALMSDMKTKADAVYALYSPLEEFGTNVGNAFAEMTVDAEKGRDSFKAAIGDMINAMMKQTVQMTQEYIKRRIMQKVNDKLVSTQIKKSTKEQTGLEKEGSAATTAIQEAAGEAKVLLNEKVGDAVVKAVGAQTQQTTQQEQTAAQTSVNTEASKTTADINLGIASGAAKTIGKLGWWGIPLIAAISATLNALLGFAMSSVSKLFGGGTSTDTNKNTKLVSGMLTYDSGNVQDLKPFVANDGSIYWATEGNIPSIGASLITSPTATSINGRPSLVAENGPELVIGRETTKAMMMNNPSLLKALVNYDANYSGRRAYDTGNIAATLSGLFVGGGASDAALNNAAAANAALVQVASLLLQRLQEPINANVKMYGTDGLYERMRQADRFMKGKR